MRKAIIVFTRVPFPGQTKTRMMPYLSGKECADLHGCLLRDIAVECEKVDADKFVYYTDDRANQTEWTDEDERIWKKKRRILAEVFGKTSAYKVQQGNTLGDKMYNAIHEVLGKGYDECVLIGTDIPEIHKNDLEQAFRILEERDVVFGPTKDGGYYLVGMKKPMGEVFGIKSYGHGSVLKDTLKGLAELELTTGCVRMLSDLDTPEDLKAYRKYIRDKKHLQKTNTGRFVAESAKISIIVPTYNEEKTIRTIQNQLLPLKDKCEIIFVDGGSSDRTLEMMHPAFRVIRSGKGRAVQMNTGAKESNGDVLFFLHCDSELPRKPLEQIREVMTNHHAGCFGIAFRSKQFFLLTCRVVSNMRVFDRKVMFGDQGMFMDRELFFEAGMFPEIPIMEDYQLSLTLKAMKVKFGMAKRRIYTSDRRFPKEMIPKLDVMWKMNRLRKKYRDGVAIKEISDMYRDIR